MKIKKLLCVALSTAVIFSFMLGSIVSAEKINGVKTQEEEDMEFVFGSDDGFDREIRRMILSDSENVLTATDIKKMDKDKGGKFAATKNNLQIVTEIFESKEVNTTLPSSYDISDRVPNPGDQGSLKSCTSWAIGYAALSAKEVQKRGWTPKSDIHTFSPTHLYNAIVKGENKATDYVSNFEYIRDNGLSTMSYFPVDNSGCSKQPTSIQTENAKLYKGTAHSWLKGVNQFKEQIKAGNVVILPIRTYRDFNNISVTNQIFDDLSGGSLGSHSIVLVGYDDNKGSNGAFKFMNSWGSDWGLDGYGWISYNLVSLTEVVLADATGFYLKSVATDDYKLGDIDEDGVITVNDSQVVLNFSVGSSTPTARQFVLSDVDGDGKISVPDAREILRVAVGLESSFSIYN